MRWGGGRICNGRDCRRGCVHGVGCCVSGCNCHRQCPYMYCVMCIKCFDHSNFNKNHGNAICNLMYLCCLSQAYTLLEFFIDYIFKVNFPKLYLICYCSNLYFFCGKSSFNSRLSFTSNKVLKAFSCESFLRKENSC